jgi:hypothetical protein
MRRKMRDVSMVRIPEPCAQPSKSLAHPPIQCRVLGHLRFHSLGWRKGEFTKFGVARDLLNITETWGLTKNAVLFQTVCISSHINIPSSKSRPFQNLRRFKHKFIKPELVVLTT